MTPDELRKILAENPELTVLEYANQAAQPAKVVTQVTEETGSEHDEQVKLFQWAETAGIPELVMLHATPNGAKLPYMKTKDGNRFSPEAMKLKAEGLRSGYPDVSLDVARGRWHGLRIELKVGKNKPSQNQLEWISNLRYYGYMVVVAYGFIEAQRAILTYLDGEEN